MERKYCMSGVLEMILFRRLCVTPILVDHETSCVGKLISLVFYVYKERPNRSSYVSYTSILGQCGHGLRIRNIHGK
jgi:hypothetical protein